MTESALQQIVGPGSMLAMIIANIKTTIYLDPIYGWCPEFTDQMKDDLIAQDLTYEDAC